MEERVRQFIHGSSHYQYGQEHVRAASLTANRETQYLGEGFVRAKYL